MYAKEYAEFKTVTCLEWKMILTDDRNKEIVIDSLRYLSQNNRASIYGFVIMSNHFHLIWQIMGDNEREDVQRDFLKYTGQQIIKGFKTQAPSQLEALEVNAKDRRYQVWERNSLGIPLWTDQVMWQKLNYMHDNPVRAGLCRHAEDYKYSSARFYLRNEKSWDFLVHIDG